AVLASDAARPRTTVAQLVLRGVLQNTGPNTGRLLSLNARSRITITPPAMGNAEAVTETLRLFLAAPALQSRTWAQIQNEALPEPVAAADFRAHYRAEQQTAQTLWRRFLQLQSDLDRVVCDWYGFDEAQRDAIAAGLPWARRRQPVAPVASTP
ncbi:MAG: hypothetical protein M3Y28_12215, partial [Armatimonadota bacterium]|nr:hypothetical protein [Armatimonadota bacterium]